MNKIDILASTECMVYWESVVRRLEEIALHLYEY